MNSLKKLLALGGLALTLVAVFRTPAEELNAVVDVRALLLVFVAPLFLLVVFAKESLGIRGLIRRARELFVCDTPALRRTLSEAGASGSYSAASVLKLTESHSDSFVRYAGNLFSCRYEPAQLAQLLRRRISAEDAKWAAALEAFRFLAKMAPYFGMLATVIGMVNLLGNLNDFSRISVDMALAMKGTLYGLISFVLIYSPLQKLIQGYRIEVYKRNDMVARWILLVAERAEASYVRAELRADAWEKDPTPELSRLREAKPAESLS